MEPMDHANVSWLMQWFRDRCDGSWEHEFGITISTLDNPGWRLSVDLRETKFSAMEMAEISIESSEHDWFVCRIVDRRFEAAGDAMKLNRLIEEFKKAIDAYESPAKS